MNLSVWWLAARPKTLWAGVAPVVVGAAAAQAHGVFHGPSALCALLGALLIQVGTNYHNDWCDFVKGADTEHRTGPTRATQAGLVAPRAMRNAAVLTLALAFVPGAYIVYRGGWPFIVVGVVSIVCAVAYTAGPLPLGYIGLADLFVFVFFGPVAVGGTYYVQARALPADVLVAGLAPGLLSVALLTVNNLRDIDGDRRAGKRSLAVRFGVGFARFEYFICVVGATFAVPLYLFGDTGNRYFLAAALVSLAFGAPAIHAVYATRDPAVLNRVLARTGKLLLVFAVAFSLAWLA